MNVNTGEKVEIIQPKFVEKPAKSEPESVKSPSGRLIRSVGSAVIARRQQEANFLLPARRSSISSTRPIESGDSTSERRDSVLSDQSIVPGPSSSSKIQCYGIHSLAINPM
jgi:hypothetical protein